MQKNVRFPKQKDKVSLQQDFWFFPLALSLLLSWSANRLAGIEADVL